MEMSSVQKPTYRLIETLHEVKLSRCMPRRHWGDVEM